MRRPIPGGSGVESACRLWNALKPQDVLISVLAWWGEEARMQARSLGTWQADALEQLGNSEIERAPAGWVVSAHPSLPVIPHQTVRSLADRGLCRIFWRSGREAARITQTGRKAWREIEAARARIGSAA
jgi:hypothetical protein